MKYCRSCNYSFDDSQNFCTECGAQLEIYQQTQNFCTNCQTPITESTKFCTNCGMQIGANHSQINIANVQTNTNTSKNVYTNKERGFIDNFSHILKNSFNFSGRTSRREYWRGFLAFFLFNILLSLLAPFLMAATDSIEGLFIVSGLVLLIQIALMPACISLNVRRLHDVGKSGWWLLISLTGIGSFYLLYLFVQPGNYGNNQYGQDPRI